MRAFLLFIILLLPLVSFSQKTVHLWDTNLTDNTFEQGDSAWIKIKFSSAVGTWEDSDTLILEMFYDEIWDRRDTVLKKAVDIVMMYPKENDGAIKIKFKIPDNSIIGGARLYVKYRNFDPIPFSIIENPTSIINPITERGVVIYYFDILGNEIKKPTEGLFIWKSESGETGKGFIKNQ